MTLSRRTWIILSVVFVFFAMPAAAYIAHRSSCLREPEYWLVIENQMPIEVTIVNEAVGNNGEELLLITLGTVPAGQTEKLALVMPIPEYTANDLPKMPEVATCELRAQDSAGSVVWEMSWSEHDFDDLAEKGQAIVISPQSDSQEGKP